jgi:hypothetical protein
MRKIVHDVATSLERACPHMTHYIFSRTIRLPLLTCDLDMSTSSAA